MNFAPNIVTQDYQLTFVASSSAAKIRRAEIIISAPSEEAARSYAENWLRQGVMRQTVLTDIEMIRPDIHCQPCGSYHPEPTCNAGMSTAHQTDSKK